LERTDFLPRAMHSKTQFGSIWFFEEAVGPATVIAIAIAAKTVGDAIEEIFFNLNFLSNCGARIVSRFSCLSVIIEGCCVLLS